MGLCAFGLVAGALALWLGLCLLFGALDLQLGLRTHIEEGGLQPPLLMRLLVVFFFVAGALDLWLELRTRMEEGGLRPRFF